MPTRIEMKRPGDKSKIVVCQTSDESKVPFLVEQVKKRHPDAKVTHTSINNDLDED